MSGQPLQSRLSEHLRTAAVQHTRAMEARLLTEALCSRSSESRALTEDHLKRTRDGLFESHDHLRRARGTLAAICEIAPLHESENDAPASAALGIRIGPAQAQIAAYVLKPPTGPGWVHELKHNGYRLICQRSGTEVVILDCDGRDWSARFPSLVAALLALDVHDIRLDGDAVIFDEIGLASRERIDDAIVRRDATGILFLAFDLLSLNGEEMSYRSLIERKERLRKLLRDNPDPIRYAAHLRQDGAKMLRQADILGLEGIVSKRANAPYLTGLSLDWRMTKCVRRGGGEPSTEPSNRASS